jgi:uncharacterized damage-inducible protein DinB
MSEDARPIVRSDNDVLLLDIAHCEWADQCMLTAASALSAEEAERDLGLSHKSVLETLQHSYESECFWLERLRAGTLPPLAQIGAASPRRSRPTLAQLTREWPQVWAGLREWFAHAGGDVTVELRSELADGAAVQFTRQQLIRHLTNHSAMHRGQVVGMLRMLGKQPPNTDVMSYLLLGRPGH